ncbi:MAG: YibE/F family protein [bacterium]|nr:YibE/F family protein [bacterium]
MSVNLTLMILLFVLMCVIGRDRGFIAFFSLLFNVTLLLFMMFFIRKGSNIIFVLLITCILLTVYNVFIVNEWHKKTIPAFISILLTILLVAGLSFIIVNVSHIQGFTSEELDDLMVFNIYLQIDYRLLSVCVIIITLLGALIDAAISISSAIYEVYLLDPSISGSCLMTIGLRMAGDILSTNINTLYFAFLGSGLSFLSWLYIYNYSFGDLINHRLFVGNLVTLLISGIGCILVIPICTGISSWYFSNFLEHNQEHS